MVVMLEDRIAGTKEEQRIAQPQCEKAPSDAEAKPIAPAQGEGAGMGISGQNATNEADHPEANEMITAVDELFEWIRQDLQIHERLARGSERREEEHQA
jgi:hypothetical protein